MIKGLLLVVMGFVLLLFSLPVRAGRRVTAISGKNGGVIVGRSSASGHHYLVHTLISVVSSKYTSYNDVFSHRRLRVLESKKVETR